MRKSCSARITTWLRLHLHICSYAAFGCRYMMAAQQTRSAICRAYAAPLLAGISFSSSISSVSMFMLEQMKSISQVDCTACVKDLVHATQYVEHMHLPC